MEIWGGLNRKDMLVSYGIIWIRWVIYLDSGVIFRSIIRSWWKLYRGEIRPHSDVIGLDPGMGPCFFAQLTLCWFSAGQLRQARSWGSLLLIKQLDHWFDAMRACFCYGNLEVTSKWVVSTIPQSSIPTQWCPIVSWAGSWVGQVGSIVTIVFLAASRYRH